ncbi:MAG: hypothetical protein ABIS07_08720 [Dokdonella sp.]
MACFPKIDQPCPLGIAEQERIAGYCGRCSTAVHALDAMSDAERMTFLHNATGPVCVSYRVNLRRGVSAGIGVAALVLSMSGAVRAIDVPVAEGSGVHADASQTTSATPKIADGDKHDEVLLMGGVRDPKTAELIDDADVADLPMVRDARAPMR